ncbi:MAG: prepilin-type N-terminal cleavage/methylation domain-containing protein [Mycobacteriales bacterium]
MRHRGDDGVTLIELLVVLSISGVVATAIAAAFAVGVKTTDTANKRLAGSQGAQIATSFFPSDVRTSKTGPAAAGSCNTGTSKARFDWNDADAGTPPVVTAKRAEYCAVTAGTPAQTDLVREYRENGSLVGSVIVAYKITSASVGCAPDCTAPVSVTLTVLAPDNSDFTVTGRRRMP